MHGIESFLGNSGAATNGFVATPSDTYAGLTTGLGDYGGAWSQSGGATTWPTGTGDAHYDFWSPLIVDYTDTAWAAATKTWPNTCTEALRYGIIKGRKNKSKRGMLDLIMLENELYRQTEEKIATSERLLVQRGEKKKGLYALGFEDVINFDGVDISYEYGVPSAIGYGFCMDAMELQCLDDTIFSPKGPDLDIATQMHRIAVVFYGNLRFNVRCFCAFKAVT